LLANKSDLVSAVQETDLEQFCKENDFIGVFKTSALDNTGIGVFCSSHSSLPFPLYLIDAIMGPFR
jgi:hypothetical protein